MGMQKCSCGDDITIFVQHLILVDVVFPPTVRMQDLDRECIRIIIFRDLDIQDLCLIAKTESAQHETQK